MNRQDLFNEIIVSLIFYWKYAYTGVYSKNQELLFAKIECGVILLFCLINLVIIVYSIYYLNKRIMVYAYNIVNYKLERFLKLVESYKKG